jgi:hypothetical protein
MQRCQDSSIHRWKGDDRKTCNWIGRSESRSENLCVDKHVMLSCPQACRKCCSNDDHYQFTSLKQKKKKCTWIKTDKRRKNYCNTAHFGAIGANKCPLNCGVCAITDSTSPTMSGNPTMSPIIELGGSSTNEGCADSDVYCWRSDPVKSCDWIGRNANYVDNLCP